MVGYEVPRILYDTHGQPAPRRSTLSAHRPELLDMGLLGSSIALEPIETGERTRRQIALRLLPFLFILYIASFIDRTSVAFAALGMSSDLGLSDRTFGLGAGIFFLGYIALQIPGAMLVERWSARRAIALIMIAWGGATAFTGLIHTPSQLYWARLVLGAAEAGFVPGVIVYLSHWFSHADRARATAYFMAAIPFSQVIASPVAGWIVGHSFAGIQGWRWLFILEGLPAASLGAIAYFYLTDRPREARWLSAAQREWLQARLRAEATPPTTRQPSSIGQALRSPAVLLLSLAAFLNYFTGYAFVFWFPILLKRESGLSDALVGTVGAIPYAAAFAAMLVNGWHSDKRMERHWHAALPCLLAAAGALGLMSHPQSLPLAILLFTLFALAPACLPPFWALATTALDRSAAPAGVGFINAVGSIAGFAGPFALGYLSSRTGSFGAGMAAAAAAGIGASLVLLSVPASRPVPLTPHPSAAEGTSRLQ
ncbi:MAG TPA: MFS transporter [Steroidobacteraceae bacterium]|nr:MFS transporter [Steroidobacteraceae bacterium]